MYTKKEYQVFRVGNLIYKKAYPLYRPVYFLWKQYRDRELIKFLKQQIKPGMTVVDVGANIGFYSVLFSKLVGEKGSVHAFEPDATNFKHLVSNTRKLKNVFVNHAAASDKTGKIKLYQFDSNVEYQTYDNGESTTFTEIDCIALDDYFNKGESIGFMKTDTEGYDYFVISGMQETIKRQKSLVLTSEFWPWGLTKAGVEPKKYVTLLKELGFDITFTDENAEHEYEEMAWNRYFITDILAMLKR
jgi:FkbM family methyltransferase